MRGDDIAMHLLLRDTAQKRVAIAALDSLWPRYDSSRELRFGVDSFVATPAYWDLAELYDWLQILVTNLPDPAARNMNGWGIDVRRNRILLTVESASRIPALVRWLDQLHLPCRLVAIQVSGPFVLTAGPPPNKPLLQSPQTLVEGAHVLRHVRVY